MEWQPIETAPEGEPHLRGLWVYSVVTGKPIYFDVSCGYIDDDGCFVSMSGDDDFGWSADDYDFWAPLPPKFPNSIKKKG